MRGTISGTFGLRLLPLAFKLGSQDRRLRLVASQVLGEGMELAA